MIEIKKPGVSGNNLFYPIKQVVFNLTNSDLQNLNTTPFELLPADTSYYAPIQVTIKFNCIGINTGINYFIGYTNLLNISLTSSYCTFDTAYFGGSTDQFLSLGIKNQNFWTNNSVVNQPLVLWQQANDFSANYYYFDLILTYIEYPTI